MDFSYSYTDEQQRFRQEVASWLDANLPQGAPGDGTRYAALRRRLGERGWLAPTEPERLGGGGLTPGHRTVLVEELAARGLRGLLSDPSASLRRALDDCGTEAQKERLLPAINRGVLAVWRTAPAPGAEPDAGDLGVRAYGDGDDYVLNGEAAFAGPGRRPDILWTLALTDQEGAVSVSASTCAFLVPAGLDGIAVRTPRLLVEGETHRVTFLDVRVPRSALLGGPGDGWPSMRSAILPEPSAEQMPLVAPEVADLWDHARQATREGMTLSQDPALRQLLVEAYINGRLRRLFRMRDAWMRATGRPLSYEAAETALLEKRAARRHGEILREVVGIHGLLDRDDPRAPARGAFERQQRQGLMEQVSDGPIEAHAAAMARDLGMDGYEAET